MAQPTWKPNEEQLRFDHSVSFTYLEPSAGTIRLWVQPKAPFVLKNFRAETDTGSCSLTVELDGNTVGSSRTANTSSLGSNWSLSNTSVSTSGEVSIVIGSVTGTPTKLFVQFDIQYTR